MKSDAYLEQVGGSNVEPISKKGTRWPPNAKVPEEWIKLGYELREKARLPRINLRLEADKFVDHWIQRGDARACKVNWLATWRNWVRTAYGAVPEPAPQAQDDTDLSIKRVKAALRGARSAYLSAHDVRLALSKGAITKEEARRLGL